MHQPSILVIDDEPMVRHLLARILGAEGWMVTEFDRGEPAIERLEAGGECDLVLLDLGLPGLQGFEVCEWIKGRRETRLVPVIILTGMDGSAERIRCIDAGADDFISKPFDRLELLARVRSLLRLKAYTDELEHAESVLFALARSIEARDPYTHGHCERLSALGVALGQRLGLDEEQLDAIRKAGVLHDIGKIVVPDAILLKDGPLTPEEREVMRRHPITGDEICQPIRSFAPVRPIIRHHHERMDGTGYPDGLAGDEIPITARVLQVVDVFDALTTERPYKPAYPVEQALMVLRDEAGKGWYDRHVVAAFCSLESTGLLGVRASRS